MSNQAGSTGVKRRDFLKVLGASSAAVAAVGCSSEKVGNLIPYVVSPDETTAGVSQYYATTCRECAASCGIIAETRDGRITKLEGNPDDPFSRGALCARGQSALQGLYNPDRIRGPMVKENGAWKPIEWDAALTLVSQKMGEARSRGAAPNGVFLNQHETGSFPAFLDAWLAGFGMKPHLSVDFESDSAAVEANRTAYGVAWPRLSFKDAKIIVSFGADFLDGWGLSVPQQLDFADARAKLEGAPRFIYIGPRRSLTGLNADQWIACRPGTELSIANALAGKGSIEEAATASGVAAATLTRLKQELSASTPALVLAGTRGPDALEVAQAVAAINQANGANGTTIRPAESSPAFDTVARTADVLDVVERMRGGLVPIAFIRGVNPAYALPASARFAEAFAKVPFKVSTSLVVDETTVQCDLVLPGLHALERWDDANPRAGVWGLMQPVMEPVYPNRHPGDVLLAASQKAGGPFAKFTAANWEAHLKAQWTSRAAGDAWRAALARGGVYAPAATASVGAPVSMTVDSKAPTFEGSGEFTLLPYASSLLYDGRGTNKPWLLETPDPVTKITWHAWVELHPDAAARLDVREGEILRVTSAHGSVEAPAYIYPGLRPDVVAIPMGFGHAEYGEYAKDRGVNYLDLLGPTTGDVVAYVGTKVTVERTREYRKVAKTEGTTRQLGRGIAEAMPVAFAAKGLTIEEAAKAAGHPAHEINTEREVQALKGWREGQVGREEGRGRRLGNYPGEHPMWGMTIDLARCTGCSACSTACYAENNIPWVGEDQILRGRELSWIRIERYWEGGTDGEPIEARFVPMPCQHCDNAPCEPVCPVYAAYHTPDGLNGQVYNRCVGTRYCANNCPYKVRYFNWHAYARKAFVAPFDLQLNPDVVVRARGVMEKCTFCVQRIRGAQHAARVADGVIKDGELTTACAQACPSGAITFGDLNDPESRVRQRAQDPRGYHILEDINVRPAITYLAKVVHREPAHAAPGGEESH